MTAVVSAESVTGPVGYALAGPALSGLGLRAVYLLTATGMTAVALMFLAATARAEPAELRAEAA